MSLSQYKVLFFAIVVLILAFSDKGQISGDGLARWNALVTLMEDGKLTRDKYSMIQPLFAIPLYVVGEFWARFSLDGPTRGDSDAVDKEKRIGVIRNVVKRFNKFVVLLISILFYHILQNFYGFDRTHASLGTLFLLFGSLLIPNARDFYSECLGSLLTLFALVSLSTYFRRTGKRTNVRSLFYTVLPIALLIGSTPIALGPVLVLIFYMTRVCVKEQRAGSKLPSMMWPSSPVFLAVFSSLLGIFLFLAENYIRRGALLNFGYVGEGFTTPLLTGLSGLILSPTRGIIFFVPTFLVGFLLLKKKGELPDSGLTLIRFSVIYSVSIILSYSKWHDWHGGWSYGPRYLLSLSVFGALYLVVFVKTRWPEINGISKGICFGLTLLSFLTYKIGVSIHQKHLLPCWTNNPAGPEPCYWDFAYVPYSALLNPQDLHTLITHRSTIMEIVGALLFLLLFRFSKSLEENTPWHQSPNRMTLPH